MDDLASLVSTFWLKMWTLHTVSCFINANDPQGLSPWNARGKVRVFWNLCLTLTPPLLSCGGTNAGKMPPNPQLITTCNRWESWPRGHRREKASPAPYQLQHPGEWALHLNSVLELILLSGTQVRQLWRLESNRADPASPSSTMQWCGWGKDAADLLYTLLPVAG